MSTIEATYTNRETGVTGTVRVAYKPAPSPRQAACPGFAFGPESHPDDFRCQNCGHFAWSGHAPAAAWVGASDAPVQLALAAMSVTLEGTPVAPEMLTTLRAWVRHLRARSVLADAPVVDRFVLTYGLEGPAA